MNEQPSPSSSGNDGGGGDGKLTRAQRKRLRKRKLKEAASRRRKIIGPLLPGSNDDIDRSCGASFEGVRRNAATDFSGDHSHGSVEGVRRNAAPNICFKISVANWQFMWLCACVFL